ncbi:MAG: hypothetical protein AABX70_02200 [Nanoarchaeota archaeon]
MNQEMQALLHEQIENLQGLHALNKMMDEELTLLIEETQRKILEVTDKGAESWYKERDTSKAEQHQHATSFETRRIKHNLIRTVHTKVHGHINLEGIHPEHSLDRIETKLRKHLREEKTKMHAKVGENHKKLGEHHKWLSKEDSAIYTPILKKTQELYQHIKKQSLPSEQIEQALTLLPRELYTPYLRFA